MMKCFILSSCLLFSLFLNQGCGFQLRGLNQQHRLSSFLALKATVIQGNGRVAEELNRQIQLLNLQPINNTAAKPDTQIILSEEQVEEKILTLNINNQVKEYRVYLQLNYRIKFQGETLLENGFLRIFRDYSYDMKAILGKESEQKLLTEDMYRDAANQILQRAIILVTKQQSSRLALGSP